MIVLICYGIYYYNPDFSETVEKNFEYYTGYSRNSLPKSIRENLNFLDFKKISEDGKEFLYYYELDESEKKRLVLIVTDKNSTVLMEDEIIDNIVEESTNLRTFSITLFPIKKKINIVVQCKTRPNFYLGEDNI